MTFGVEDCKEPVRVSGALVLVLVLLLDFGHLSQVQKPF